MSLKKNLMIIVSFAMLVICIAGTVYSYAAAGGSGDSTIIASADASVSGKPDDIQVEESNPYGGYTIDQLQQMFPAGMYWNGGKDENPDSVTNSGCFHPTGYDPNKCNIFQGGTQCVGYALRLSYLYHGGQVPTYDYGISHNIEDLKVGDMVRYKVGAYDHSIFITGISANGIVTYSDCNWDLRCGIRWGQRTTKAQLAEMMKARLNTPYDVRSHQYSETGFILSYDKRKITYDINTCDITVSDVNRYKGENEPKVVIKHGDKLLTYGVDYDFYHTSRFYDGGYIMIEGIGSYKGEILKEYKIVREQLCKCTATYTDTFEYTGEKIWPQDITVRNQYGEVIDSAMYTISEPIYASEPGEYYVDVSPAEGQDVYEGELRLYYQILPRDIADCTIEYEGKVRFLGYEVTPEVVISNGEHVLRENDDYIITYKNNGDIGTGRIIIKANPNGSRYVGEVELEFEIYAVSYTVHID